jgi:hypothetical protein
MMPRPPADSGTQEAPGAADLQGMLTTLARALALALALLALPSSAQAAGSAPLLATSQATLSVLAGWEAGFTAHATDPDGDIVTLSWAFDDGTFAGNVEHAGKAWETPGAHVASVTATDATGLSSTHSFVVDVQPNPNHIMPLPTSPPPGFVFPDVNAQPEAALADPRLKLSRTRSVPVRITCKARPCKGTVALRLGGKLVGTASFSLRPDQTTTAYVRVSRLVAARLRKHRSVAVAVTLAVRGAEPATGTLTLRTR